MRGSATRPINALAQDSTSGLPAAAILEETSGGSDAPLMLSHDNAGLDAGGGPESELSEDSIGAELGAGSEFKPTCTVKALYACAYHMIYNTCWCSDVQ